MAKLMKVAQIGFVTLAMMTWTENAIAQVNAYFAANGFDSNPCTQAAPCLTLSQASAMSYPPGSTINFRGGDNFTGCWALTPTNVPGGGDKDNPIVVQSYGTGRATMVSNCSGNYNPQFDIAGISGVVVQNLKFQGNGATTEVGILIEGPGDTIIIQNNEVTGFVFVSNVAGEILVLGLGAHGVFGCNSLNNIQVLDNSLHGASVTSRDANGIYGFGCGRDITNVHYAGNHVWNMGGGGSSAGPFSPNGIVVNGVASGIVEHNLVHDIGANQTTCGGPIGIMAFNAGSDTSPGSILIQFNEVYNVQPVPDQGLGCDFAAYDIDGGGTINVTLQYNYSHDNAGAAWMICCGAGDGNVIRYNISENDDKYYKSGGVVVVSDVVFQVYNNTVWIPPVGADPNHAQACYVFGFSGTFPVGALIANNICYAGSPDQAGTAWYADSGAQVPPDITNVQFFQNLYNVGGLWRINGGVYHSLPEVLAIGKEAGSIVSDPNVTAPGGGGTCAWDPTQHNGPQPCPAAYRLLTGSRGLDAGVDLRAAPYNLDVGTQDYYGNPITTTPNIGADQDQ